MRQLYIIIVLLFLTGCSSTTKIPNDFSFTIKESYEFAYDYYDSQKSEYKRNYRDSVATIRVSLSKEERNKIFNAFKDVDFRSFPDKFESIPNNNGTIDLSDLPGSTIEVSLTLNGKTKTVYYNSSDTSDEFKLRTQKFRDFEKFVWAIIQNKRQVKTLKKADWMFM